MEYVADQLLEVIRGDDAGSVGEFCGFVAGAEQAGQWYDDPNPVGAWPLRESWCGESTGWQMRRHVDGFSYRMAVGVDALQASAEEFACVGVNIFDLQPVGLASLRLGVVLPICIPPARIVPVCMIGVGLLIVVAIGLVKSERPSSRSARR